MKKKTIQIDYKLLLILFLSFLIPSIYSTTRIYFLGVLPETNAFNIAAQIAWLNIFYEILKEALFLPLFFILGKVIKKPADFSLRLLGSCKIIVVIYLLITVIIYMLTPELTAAMQQSPDLINVTVTYIRLESIGIFISILFEFFLLVLVIQNNQSALYILLITKTVLMVLFDFLLVSQLSFSLQLGVNGVAYTNIIVNTLLGLLAVYYLEKSILKNYKLTKKNIEKREEQSLLLIFICYLKQSWIKEWFIIGIRSGLESLVRNLAFVMMILQLVNQVQQAGIYWLTNSFIWGWLLIPILALGELVKQDTATHQGLSLYKIKGYLLLVAFTVAIWILTIPFWEYFIKNIMGIDEAHSVKKLALLMLSFYIIFAFNHVIDSYFYGIGRTDLMLYQSLIVNLIFYVIAYWLYTIGLFQPTLNRIGIMFGSGILMDAIITFILFLFMYKENG